MTNTTHTGRIALRSPVLSRAVIVPLFALVGFAYAYLVVGGRVLNPLDVSWLQGDAATGQVGWEFFRRSTQFWPLTNAGELGYPFGTSIAYLDSIPIVAVLLKPLAPLLPEDFQYLGLFFAGNLVLQGYFAVRLLRNVCGDDPAAVLIGAAFIVFAPPLTLRALGHFALTAHWLIVAALSYYADDPRTKGAAHYLRPFCVLAAIAGSINPYLTLLTILTAAAAALHLVLRKLLHPYKAIAAVGALCFVAIGSLWLFGFLSLRAGYAGGGYTVYSMNVLSPIDPLEFPSLLLPKQTVGPGQYEGYNYLGLGIVAMLAAGLVLRPGSLRDLRSLDVLPLVALSVICFLLAVSTHIRLGPWMLIKIGLGQFITDLLASFRASGRLYWPVHYLLIVAAIVLMCRIVPVRFRGMVLAALLIIQFADTQSLRNVIRSRWTANVAAAPLVSPEWHSLGKRHRHLAVIPPWQCGEPSTPATKDGYWIFPMLAVREGMTINSYYAGRYAPDHLVHFCTELDRIKKQGLRADTAYVFSDDAFKALTKDSVVTSHSCRRIDGFQLCTSPGPG